MSITLGPIGLDAVPALAKLHQAAEAVDDTGEHYNEDDLAEELENPDLELGEDVIGAYDGDELVGYCLVMARRAGDNRKAYVFGMTHPDRRGEGIGTRLAEAMLARAEEMRGGSPLKLVCTVLATNTAQCELLASFGLAPDRWQFGMRTTLADRVEVPPVPAGYAVRHYQPSDEEPWLAVHNEAFRDHPNFSMWELSEWRQWVTTSRNFRSELSFFLTPEGDPGCIAAYVQTNEYDAYEQATGRREAYVAKVGTLPAHRGRGLAGWLLRHCLAAYRAAGFDESSLDVDSMNPTGALGIYERAGFETERRFATYARTLT